MKRFHKKIGFTAFGLILSLLVMGCAAQSSRAPAVPIPEAQGAVFEIGEVKAGSFETPAYLPGRIRFWLEQDLREKGLLATPPATGKKLLVNLKVAATFPGFVPAPNPCLSCYSQLDSLVQVTDARTGATVAQTEVTTYNTWGEPMTDFTETTNAERIAEFLEGISR